MSRYLEAPTRIDSFKNQSIFLAGSISESWDWQGYVYRFLKDLDITIVNPRRSKFDLSDINVSKEQICWEYDYLRKVSHILFWFSHETVAPITLFELGASLERNKQKIIIGCDPKYKRIFDVELQSSLQGYKLPVFKDLDVMSEFIKGMLK
jgi:hypothetical protein